MTNIKTELLLKLTKEEHTFQWTLYKIITGWHGHFYVLLKTQKWLHHQKFNLYGECASHTAKKLNIVPASTFFIYLAKQPRVLTFLTQQSPIKFDTKWSLSPSRVRCRNSFKYSPDIPFSICILSVS